MDRFQKTLAVINVSNPSPYNFELYGNSEDSVAPRPARLKIASYLRELSKVRSSVIFDDRVKALLEKYVIDLPQFREVLELYSQTSDENRVPFSRSYRDWSMVQSALTDFTRENHVYFGWNKHYKQAKQELKNQFEFAELSRKQYLNDRDIAEYLPRTDTNAGLTGFLTGKRSKGENMDGIHEMYSAFRANILESGRMQRPIIPATRTQGSGVFDELGRYTGVCKHKTRMVSMVDLLQILAELEFARPVQLFMSDHLSWYMGGKNDEYIYKRIMHERGRLKYFASLDYSGFDATISDWLIRDAFDVIKSAFKTLSEEDEKLFSIIREAFIHKVFITPNGVIESHRGVPSGSMFTQMVDSIVNYLVIRTYLLHLQNFNDGLVDDFSLFIMGDDNLVYYKHGPLDLEDISSYVSKNFGLKINAEKSSSGGWEDFPEFLSRHWTDQGAYRHPWILVGRLLYPERFRDYYSGKCKPEEVILAYIYAYNAGMRDLMKVEEFLKDYNYSLSAFHISNLDGRVLPGYLAYLMAYEVKARERE